MPLALSMMTGNKLMLIAVWRGRRAQIAHESIGRFFVRFDDGSQMWLLRGAPDLELVDLPAAKLKGCRAMFLETAGTIIESRGNSVLFRADDQTSRYKNTRLSLNHPNLIISLPDSSKSVGRPRIFTTNADRQRAYRERQRALRNSLK